jgi:hypothetical protein
MKKYLLFAAFFLVLNTLIFAELTKTQMWAISLTGISTEEAGYNRNSLNVSSMNEALKDVWLEVLKRDWDITTREELLKMLDNLENGGHAASLQEIHEIIYKLNDARDESEMTDIVLNYQWDQNKLNRFNYVTANYVKYYNRTIKAWDLGRCVSLCRWGYNVGFITESEAWGKIFRYAKLIQSLYNSWEEYGYDYLLGRVFWASGFGEEESYLARTEPVYRQLLNGSWSLIDWRTDLNQRETTLPVKTIHFLTPDDKDGTLQYMTNDPATYDKFYFNYSPNPNANPNIYECQIKKISGRESYGYGILFCVDDTDKNNVNYYRLFITVNGRFTVAKRIGNTWATAAPVSWTNSPFINTGYNVYNKIKVERIGNGNSASFRIFINGNLAAVFNDDNPINGDKAGVVVSVNVMEMEQFPYLPVDVRYQF